MFITGIADFGAFPPIKTTWLGLGLRVQFLETFYVPSGKLWDKSLQRISRQLNVISSSYFLRLGLNVLRDNKLLLLITLEMVYST